MIRPFELADLRTLHRYRQQGIYMDSISALTWGRMLVPMRAVFSPLSEAVGVFTEIYQQDSSSPALIAQISHGLGAQQARFTFLAPDSGVEDGGLAALLENLIRRLGERKVQNIIAEVDQKSNTFEALRTLSFSIYARQHVWRVGSIVRKNLPDHDWREIISQDEFNVRRLYSAIVPTLIQQVEPTPWEELRGYVFYHKDELLGYADVAEGPRGIWLQPFIHPEMEGVGPHLTSLIASLKPKERRPVYVCLRSYQAWLSATLEDLDAEVSSTQAVMVRRLTAAVKKPELSPIPTINGTQEVTSPYQKNSQAETQQRASSER
jgi:hypothetical protein